MIVRSAGVILSGSTNKSGNNVWKMELLQLLDMISSDGFPFIQSWDTFNDIQF